MRSLVVSSALLLACTGQASTDSPVDVADDHGGGQHGGGLHGGGLHEECSDVQLYSSDTHLLQLDETAWSFTKTGSVAGSTVTWTITATRGSTETGKLIVDGYMIVTNDGAGEATIGNIVVDLQTVDHYHGHHGIFGHHGDDFDWTTVSSDVADATADDAATTARVVVGPDQVAVVSENAASGHLLFMDATNNTVFSLVPEKTVPGRSSIPLLFSASFDNNVLGLEPGTQVRAQVIVTFGNSTGGFDDAHNVDINGNGVIDVDEHDVRSVYTQHDVTVPKPTDVNQSPTISDASADFATTGTVSLSNPVFDLGATSGTVTVQAEGGPSGGSVTNCASLDSPNTTTQLGGFTFNDLDGIHLVACNTENVKASVCEPGTPGCGWQNGQVISYAQSIWGGVPGTDPGATLLVADFDTVYAATAGVIVGSPSGFTMVFTDTDSVLAYQPSIGPYAALDASVLNPISTASGAFGGDVLGLEFNVDFSDDGFLVGTSGDVFGDLTLCGLTGAQAAVNGESIRQFLAVVNTLLSGGTSVLTIADLGTLVSDTNASFGAGTPSTFAQLHVVNGSCP